MKRAIVIVLDGCGAGAAPDASEFGDPEGEASTLLHVWQAVGGFGAPNLAATGFLAAGRIDYKGEAHLPPGFGARHGRLQELTKAGKDSVSGHWEMMGIVLDEPFPTYPDGFPIPLIKQLEREIATQTLGNCPASGTEIIARLGGLHMDTGFPIVYTSADSVFQIACHQEVVPLDKLYDWCRIARKLCVAPNNVERVIARPFIGNPKDGFARTEHRRDFPLTPPPNLVDEIGEVFGIGVVPELFDGRGFRKTPRSQSNSEHAQAVFKALESDARFVFANFEDTDMLFGHRNDPKGFAGALETFDAILGDLLSRMTEDDLLLLTADHGNDPTTESTDHSREYVPVAVVGRGVSTADLGDVSGMAAIGATVAQHLGVGWPVGASLI